MYFWKNWKCHNKKLGVTGTIQSNGTNSVGGICGDATNSTITNCYNTANISVNSTENFWGNSAGGISGSGGTITDCYNTGNISATTAIGGTSYAGGISGSRTGEKITNCYNMGKIYATTSAGGISGNNGVIENCFVAVCKMEGSYAVNIGCLGDVNNCYADDLVYVNGKHVSGQGGEWGNNTTLANFKTLSWVQTTLGWDFSSVWCIFAGKFPELQMQYNNPTGIEKINTAKISIYPNPAKDYLFIQSDYPIYKVEIYSQSGVCVLLNNNVKDKIDVSGLTNGFYLVRFYSDGMMVTKKIIINN